MSIQAGAIQAGSVRGGAQLAAVFAFLVALFAGLIGLAIVLRPSVAATTTGAIYDQTHPVMVDRGVDTFAGSPTILAPSEWSVTHPVMADRGAAVGQGGDMSSAAYAARHGTLSTPTMNAATGFVLGTVRGSDMSSAAYGALRRSISPVGAHDLLTARYATRQRLLAAAAGPVQNDMSSAAYAALHPVVLDPRAGR